MKNWAGQFVEDKTLKGKRGGPGRGQGRKQLSKNSESVRVNTSMTASQRDKFQKLGGSAWLREQIDKAEE